MTFYCTRVWPQCDFFLSFFLGFRRPNLITGLSRWRATDWPLRTQEPVLDRGTRAFPSLWQTQADPLSIRQNRSQCWWAGMYPRANQFPQSISLTTKTSVYPNLVVPPHSGEKPMDTVWEAENLINKGYQTEWRLTS